MRTSDFLIDGALYSRQDLKDQFQITDATINTGIFRPAGHDSVWLFVTEDKQADRTQYVDRLEGDDLFFEGQTQGRTDNLIQNHKDLGLELLLFHRSSKNEHPDYSFRYEGSFDFVNATGRGPTQFHLRRQQPRPNAPEPNYIALVCNPDIYDGLGAIQHLTELTWTLGRRDANPGDGVLLWQAKGSGSRRGVIALGEVIAPAAVREESEAERAFWVSGSPGQAVRRTRFRKLEMLNLPLWEDEHAEVLSGLAPARARGGTVFRVTPEQWAAVSALAGGEELAPFATRKVRATGQGFGLTAPERKAVERRAQDLAEAFYREQGYEVKDVSRTHPYDVRCRRNDEELHVEVKGTTGDGASIILTRNEVSHARNHPGQVALVLVTRIALDRSGPTPIASGGHFVLIHPWQIDDENLSPLQFELRVDQSIASANSTSTSIPIA